MDKVKTVANKNNKQPVWALRIAACLLCLAVLTVCFMSNLYARYQTSDGSGDGARVAKFNVTSSLTETSTYQIDVAMVPGAQKEYQIQITNDSEVAVKCTISATNKTNNLPLTFAFKKVTGEGEQQYVTALVGENQHEDNYNANDNATYTYYLLVEWPEEQNSFDYQGMIDNVVISVVCEQTN